MPAAASVLRLWIVGAVAVLLALSGIETRAQVEVTAPSPIRPDDPRLDPPGPTATGAPGSALPADVLVIPPVFSPGTVLTVQGLLGDRASRARKPVSLTNAVVVKVE